LPAAPKLLLRKKRLGDFFPINRNVMQATFSQQRAYRWAGFIVVLPALYVAMARAWE
jgi:hypothetical protein